MNELVKWNQFDLTALAGPAGEVAIDDPRRELRLGVIIAQPLLASRPRWPVRRGRFGGPATCLMLAVGRG